MLHSSFKLPGLCEVSRLLEVILNQIYQNGEQIIYCETLDFKYLLTVL